MLQPISAEEFKRLRTRAREGDPNALAELAETYRMGRVVGQESIEPNPENAEKLWRQAAKAGHPRAVERRRIRRSLRQERGVTKAFDIVQRWVRNLGVAVTIGVTASMLVSQSMIWYRTAEWPAIGVLDGLRWIGIDAGTIAGSDENALNRILALVLEVPLWLVLLLLGLVLTALLLRLIGFLRPSRFQ